MQRAISSKRHKAREFPRFFGDLIRLGIKRSVIFQLLPMGGKDAVNHGSILVRFPVDLYLAQWLSYVRPSESHPWFVKLTKEPFKIFLPFSDSCIVIPHPSVFRNLA